MNALLLSQYQYESPDQYKYQKLVYNFTSFPSDQVYFEALTQYEKLI